MKNKTYYIATFGCQINEVNSEKIAALMEKRGYKPAIDPNKAELVIINTCSVRESAENRVFGLVNNLSKNKKEQKIILTGCMLYHGKKWLKRKLPEVNSFIETPEFLDKKVLPKRKKKKHAWVPIMSGCNNFCSYCVVPYARGREKSRNLTEIYCEIEKLAETDYTKITLLGQNVNSYGLDFEKKEWESQIRELEKRVKFNCKKVKCKYSTPFGFLLAVIHQIKSIKSIAFLTSNPWDLTDDILRAMKLPKIEKHLHLPVQSGDDQILKKMNRDYTAEEYLKLINKAKKTIPDLTIGTDIIVGFPGETKKQFQNTVKLCKKVNFSKAYVARYSPRPGTVAAKYKDDVPHKEKKRRWRILNKMINE